MTDDDRFWVGPSGTPDTYQLITCLGGGAEGEVWTAVLPLSAEGRRNVAVKILPADDSTDDPESWVRHGHLLRSLSHPGLVRVLEVFTGPPKHRAGSAPGGSSRYVVMDLIEGMTLREWLDEHPDATVSHRLRALTTVAAALDEMHSGTQTAVPVAHGDVKPSNIVMRADGSTVLVDLGLTRLADGAGRVGRSRPYAAPELFAAGARSTPEADRFAFAATLVHALIGEPPPASEHGPDLAAVAARLQAGPLTARRPVLVRQVMQALAAPPDQRPAGLRAWLGSLTDTLSQLTETGTGMAIAGATVDQTTTAGFHPPVPGAFPAPATSAYPAAPAGGPAQAGTTGGPGSPVSGRAGTTAKLPGATARPPGATAKPPRTPGGFAPGTASPAAPAYAPPPGQPEPPPGRRRSRRGPLVAVAVVVVLALIGGGTAYLLSHGGGRGPTLAAGTGSPRATTGPTAVPTTPAAQPSPTISAAPSDSSSFTTSSPSPDPSYLGNGTASVAIASPDVADGFIAGSNEVDAQQSVAINGKVAVNAFVTAYGCCGSGTLEATEDVNLERGYTKLTGRFGIEDNSTANEADQIRVYADNRLIYDHSFSLGQSQDVTLNVTGVLRLRFDFVGPLAEVQAAVGDPTVYQ